MVCRLITNYRIFCIYFFLKKNTTLIMLPRRRRRRRRRRDKMWGICCICLSLLILFDVCTSFNLI